MPFISRFLIDVRVMKFSRLVDTDADAPVSTQIRSTDSSKLYSELMPGVDRLKRRPCRCLFFETDLVVSIVSANWKGMPVDICKEERDDTSIGLLVSDLSDVMSDIMWYALHVGG
jgi:hypothetical protein